MLLVSWKTYAKQFTWILCLLLWTSKTTIAQSRIIVIHPVDEGARIWMQQEKIPIWQSFSSGIDSTVDTYYLQHLIQRLQASGYWAASIDSSVWRADTVDIWLYAGHLFTWGKIGQGNIPNMFWHKIYTDRFNSSNVKALRQRLLEAYLNHGYPFAKLWVDSLRLQNDTLFGIWHVDSGPVVMIDTILQEGTARLSAGYLAYVLGIKPGDVYNEHRLKALNERIQAINFLQQTKPWWVEFRTNRAILHLTLDARKANQFDGLIGYQPAIEASGKGRMVGQLNLHLVNSFHGGEVLDMHWEQLQYASPALTLSAQLPVVFHTPYGVAGQFGLFRKDSSYIQLHSRLAWVYSAQPGNTYQVYWQQQQTRLLQVDSLAIKLSRQLPPYIDQQETLLGLGWQYAWLDQPLNPRKGISWQLNVEVGQRKIIRNATIVQLQDTGLPPFSFASLYDSLPQHSLIWKPHLELVYYHPLGQYATLRTSWVGAGIWSTNVFLNELYQIGGAHLLRGFDEQSIYAAQYLIWSLEYRYLVGEQAYVFAFSDNAYVREAYWQGQKQQWTTDWPTGLGLGFAFPTRVGYLQLSWAIGRRRQIPFRLQQSRIHVSYTNTF
ncbi:MAG: BamA/TamA family outer membrane protein [Thermoflavifilum sp.]|nr:BamA/TamA family outer membrane protein [Thermoflavifilum sp.]